MIQGLIFFDGDGGGLGAHSKHYAQLCYLSWLTGIEIYSVHPMFNLFYNMNLMPDASMINEHNSIQAKDLIRDRPTVTSIDILNSVRVNSSYVWILSGIHTGISWWKDLDRRCYLSAHRLMRSSQTFIGAICEKAGKQYLKEAGIDLSTRFISVQLRTFWDSPHGRSRYLVTRDRQLKLFNSIIREVSIKKDVKQVFIASDCLDEALSLASLVQNSDSKMRIVHDPHPVIHSSCGRVFGHTLFSDVHSKSHDIEKIRLQQTADLSSFSYGQQTQGLIEALGLGVSLIASSTSIAAVAGSRLSNYSDVFLVPPTDKSMSIHLSRHGNYV